MLTLLCQRLQLNVLKRTGCLNMLIPTDLNQCVLEDVNWCLSVGPSYQICVSFIACISRKNTSNQGFIDFLAFTMQTLY